MRSWDFYLWIEEDRIEAYGEILDGKTLRLNGLHVGQREILRRPNDTHPKADAEILRVHLVALSSIAYLLH